MPVAEQYIARQLFSDAIDDPVLHDYQTSFLGGQVSNVRANQLDATQWAYLENMDVARSGRGQTRRGSTRLGSGVAGTGTYVQGLFYYDSPATSYLVAANNAKIYSWQSPNWLQVANSWNGSDTSVQYAFAQMVNTLYFTDGLGTLQAWDGTTETDLGGSGNTDPPAAIGALVSFTNRLIATKIPTDPDGVYFSNFLPTVAAGMWNRATQQLRVGGGEGDPITGHCPWLDFNLIIFKKRSVWVINCDPTLSVSSLTIKPIHRTVGCLAPKSAAQVGSDVFFLANDGVRSVNRTVAAETQSEISPNLSEPVQDIIDRINWAYVSTSVGIFRDNKYILAVPLDSATSPNYCLVYSALNKTWSGLWTGWTPTSFSSFVDSGVTKLSFGDKNGYVSQWLDYVQPANETDSTFQDNGTDIPVTAISRGFDMGEIRSPKTGLSVELGFYKSSAMATCQTIESGADAASFEAGIDTSTGSQTIPIVIPFTLLKQGIVWKPFDLERLGQWRELQFKITTTAKKLSMSSIAVGSFIDTYSLQGT